MLSIFLSADSTLPNGIHIYDCAKSGCSGDSFEAIVGYRRGADTEIRGKAELAEIVAEFLKSSPPVRDMAVAAYGTGGKVEFFSDLDRVGVRLNMPKWARPMVENAISDFLAETPGKDPALVERAIAEVRSRIPMKPDVPPDVPSMVREQFRNAMLGSTAKTDLAEVTPESIRTFFSSNYGTDRAFVVIPGTPAESLEEVERRESAVAASDSGASIARPLPENPAPIRMSSDLDDGGLLMGTPVPSVYYRNWYAQLMLDRLIPLMPQFGPEKPVTRLVLSLDSYYYQLEVVIPSGQRAESAETALLQSFESLQYVRASDEQLDAARQSAIEYLESGPVQEWFLTMGISERRQEGIEWLRTFSADDMRAMARDILESHPVLASWSPRVRALRLDAESLSDIAARALSSRAPAAPPSIPPAPRSAAKIVPFPPHTDDPFIGQAPVRLESGVSVVASSTYAVFAAPDSLKIFDREPDFESMQKTYGEFRSSRILVMAPVGALDRVKQQWSRFQGNAGDQTAAPIVGNITSADIPALFILKMLLDRRSIESAIWDDVHLEIRAAEGSTLAIHASESNRKRILDWIGEIASGKASDEELAWAREAAIHNLSGFQPDLQSLIWQWNSEGTLVDLRLIPASQIQDVARIFLERQ